MHPVYDDLLKKKIRSYEPGGNKITQYTCPIFSNSCLRTLKMLSYPGLEPGTDSL